MKIERPIRCKARLKGGVNLDHRKGTAECESVIMPPPEFVVLPMVQHIGQPCEPTVKKGDKVYVGTVVGTSDRLITAPIHSSVSGTVKEIKKYTLTNGVKTDAVVIESDGEMKPDPSLKSVEVKTKEDLISAAKNSGLVGLGGAGFPAHVKLNPSNDKQIDTLIINAAECEPYITSDYRECMENPEGILKGIYLIKEMLGIEKVIIAVERNKPKAIKKLLEIAGEEYDKDDSVKVMKLPSRYPQGAEKVLIYNALGRKLPVGKLPADVGCIVMNVTSVAVLWRYISTGMPLVSKRITVAGGAVLQPQNVIVPIGTPISKVIEFTGGYKSEPKKILYGGPMMGICVADEENVVLKQNNAIIALNELQSREKPPLNCIRCGRCAAACPMRLTPAAAEGALKIGDKDKLIKLGVNYCIECGCCSYSCPSKRPLTQSMRLAKAKIR